MFTMFADFIFGNEHTQTISRFLKVLCKSNQIQFVRKARSCNDFMINFPKAVKTKRYVAHVDFFFLELPNFTITRQNFKRY